jgi:SAM-dependent methyltransferase
MPAPVTTVHNDESRASDTDTKTTVSVLVFARSENRDLSSDRLSTACDARVQWVLTSATARAADSTAGSGVTCLSLDARGRGADQKIAGRLAIDAGVDLVVIIDPAEADPAAAASSIVDAFARTRCDVFTSTPEQSNRSWFGRWMMRLSERVVGRRVDPGGSRGYATAFLRSVPFEVNRDDCVFDVEIVLQALHVGAMVHDLSVIARSAIHAIPQPPALPGDGRKYQNAQSSDRTHPPAKPGALARAPSADIAPQCSAWDVLRTAIQFRMHRMGMLCALKYRHLTPSRYQDKTFMLYSSHATALTEVAREHPTTLLDIGCGPGFIAKRCRDDGVRVTGLDAFEPLPGMMDEFHRVDLEHETLPVDAFAHDCVLLLDVLEHMADPESFLLSLRNRSEAMRPGKRPPLLVISTPNIAFAAVRLNLLMGRFTYAERGILDITHKRLFTRSTLLRTLADCGYVAERVIPVGVPFQTVVGGSVGKMFGTIAGVMAKAWPTMFAFQYVVTCRPRPGVGQILRGSVRSSAAAPS